MLTCMLISSPSFCRSDQRRAIRFPSENCARTVAHKESQPQRDRRLAQRHGAALAQPGCRLDGRGIAGRDIRLTHVDARTRVHRRQSGVGAESGGGWVKWGELIHPAPLTSLAQRLHRKGNPGNRRRLLALRIGTERRSVRNFLALPPRTETVEA